MGNFLKLGLRLMVITLVAGGALGLVYTLTLPEIQRQEALQKQEALIAVMPQADAFAEISLPALDNNVKQCYQARQQDNTLKGYVLVVGTTGYGGEFLVTVGIDTAGTITGVKVGAHQETPGLGAKAASPSFESQYRGKRSDAPLRLSEDIQAISGATVTSRAVTDAVNNAGEYCQTYLAGGVN